MTGFPGNSDWSKRAELRARLKLHRVNPGDPAWCRATGHAWTRYRPVRSSPMAPGFDNAPKYEPPRALRRCVRCDCVQDYCGHVVEPGRAGANL